MQINDVELISNWHCINPFDLNNNSHNLSMSNNDLDLQYINNVYSPYKMILTILLKILLLTNVLNCHQ